jgi:hypothetical protein
VIDGFQPARNERAIGETLAQLERAGVTGADRVQLRFSFAAPGLRSAVELATTLRAGRNNRVQVRPGPRRRLRTHCWNVIVTTPPAPLRRTAIQLWSAQMEDVADTHPGCTIVGWQPLVEGARRV